MSNILFIDAAFPPPSLEGALGLCFYAGGDTPHVWTLAEIQSFKATYLLPVYVRSNPVGAAEGAADAAIFLASLTDTYKAPTGTLVALDSETSVDSAYVIAFVTAMNAGGYKVIDYGSQDFVMGNQNPDGYYWGADWTGAVHIATGDVATQYVSFSQYDLSDFGGQLPLWNTTGKVPNVGGVPAGINTVVTLKNYRVSWEHLADAKARGVPGLYEWQLELYKGGGNWELIRSHVTTQTYDYFVGIETGFTCRYRVSGGTWSNWISLLT